MLAKNSKYVKYNPTCISLFFSLVISYVLNYIYSHLFYLKPGTLDTTTALKLPKQYWINVKLLTNDNLIQLQSNMWLSTCPRFQPIDTCNRNIIILYDLLYMALHNHYIEKKLNILQNTILWL